MILRVKLPLEAAARVVLEDLSGNFASGHSCLFFPVIIFLKPCGRNLGVHSAIFQLFPKFGEKDWGEHEISWPLPVLGFASSLGSCAEREDELLS